MTSVAYMYATRQVCCGSLHDKPIYLGLTVCDVSHWTVKRGGEGNDRRRGNKCVLLGIMLYVY